MKIRRIKLENVRSFLTAQEYHISDLSILIGPNGGGKTNLLDILTHTVRRHLLISYHMRVNGTPEQPRRLQFSTNDVLNQFFLPKHSQGKGLPQKIEIEVEVTKSDSKNIGDIIFLAPEITNHSKRNYSDSPLAGISQWKTSILYGQRFIFTIIDNRLQPIQDEVQLQYLQYLNWFDAITFVRDELELGSLTMPFVFLPVNRANQGLGTTIALPSLNEHDMKRMADASHSRSQGAIANLAIGHLAKKYRILQENNMHGFPEIYYADEQIKLLKNELKLLGYDWDIKCINPTENLYSIAITKQNNNFLVEDASSGEKEILTYLFAIYGLNIRDAVVVIDEPEMHLHPKWQKRLLDMFERLNIKTGNQFIIATHSPVFVSPSSIKCVSRVHSNGSESHIKYLDDTVLPIPKHLFAIVNSQNNEKIFFADKVILVEGISDRIFFEQLLLEQRGEALPKTIEIVDVGGKNFFAAYEKVLNAASIPYAIIADLDYMRDIGNPEVKTLFSLDRKSIEEDVIDDPNSRDGASLIDRLDEAINTSNTAQLKNLWEYIKNRHYTLPNALSRSHQAKILRFIRQQYQSNVFLLSRGDLEKYLPVAYRDKDVNKLIQLTQQGNLLSKLDTEAGKELSRIFMRLLHT